MADFGVGASERVVSGEAGGKKHCRQYASVASSLIFSFYCTVEFRSVELPNGETIG
jgi:hypothetical protein